MHERRTLYRKIIYGSSHIQRVLAAKRTNGRSDLDNNNRRRAYPKFLELQTVENYKQHVKQLEYFEKSNIKYVRRVFFLHHHRSVHARRVAQPLK